MRLKTVGHISGIIPNFVTNSAIFLLSTFWNAFRAGIFLDVDSALRNVIVP